MVSRGPFAGRIYYLSSVSVPESNLSKTLGIEIGASTSPFFKSSSLPGLYRIKAYYDRFFPEA